MSTSQRENMNNVIRQTDKVKIIHCPVKMHAAHIEQPSSLAVNTGYLLENKHAASCYLR